MAAELVTDAESEAMNGEAGSADPPDAPGASSGGGHDG